MLNGAADAFEVWRSEQLARSQFSCVPTEFVCMNAWSFSDGRLSHCSGGFFSLAGIRVASNHPELDGVAQPIILQPEIGILGILLRRRAGRLEMLAQMKTEPGTVGGAQLAPTFQCTISNYTALHGGTPAPFLSYFSDGSLATTVSDSLQSEQGGRFLGKRNRNVVCLLPGNTGPSDGGAWRWLALDDVLAMLALDYHVNTDARSVLTCCDWRDLVEDGRPFARCRGQGGLGEALLDSYECPDEAAEQPLADVRRWLAAERERMVLRVEEIGLERLPDWILRDDSFTCAGAGFAVRPFQVQALDREITHWSQPLVDSGGSGLVVLVLQQRRGVPHLRLRAISEPGSRERVEWTASLSVPPGRDTAKAWRTLPGTVVLRCRQSEEGGRFHHDSNDYVVCQVPDDVELPPDPAACWLTLRQISALAQQSGQITNEARSAIACLLSYL